MHIKERLHDWGGGGLGEMRDCGPEAAWAVAVPTGGECQRLNLDGGGGGERRDWRWQTAETAGLGLTGSGAEERGSSQRWGP